MDGAQREGVRAKPRLSGLGITIGGEKGRTVEKITAALEAEEKEAGDKAVSHTLQVAPEAVGEIAQGTVWKETVSREAV